MENPAPPRPTPNEFRDSWRPADKAAEAATDNPGEFDGGPATESAEGPVLEPPLKTHGDRADDKTEK